MFSSSVRFFKTLFEGKLRKDNFTQKRILTNVLYIIIEIFKIMYVEIILSSVRH